MKSTFPRSLVTLAALLALGTGGAFAQTGAPPPGGSGAAAPTAPAAATQDHASASSGAGTSAAGDSRFLTQQKSTQTLATSIIGMSIRNSSSPDAKDIGKVTDLILNKDHKLDGIVVGVGGFLGIGQKDVGIPWSRVQEIVPAAKTAVVKVTKQELEKAPSFTTTEEKKDKAKAAAAQQHAPTAPPNTAPGAMPAAPGTPAPPPGTPPAGK